MGKVMEPKSMLERSNDHRIRLGADKSSHGPLTLKMNLPTKKQVQNYENKNSYKEEDQYWLNNNYDNKSNNNSNSNNSNCWWQQSSELGAEKNMIDHM